MNKVFKALSDPTRRRVLEMLRRGPMTAGDIAAEFDVSKPTMSAHFSVLKEADLVLATKVGKTVTYQIRMSVLEEALFGFASVFGLDGSTTKTGGADAQSEAGAPTDMAGQPEQKKEA